MAEDEPHRPRTVSASVGVPHEASATAEARATVPATATVLRWPPITAETLAVAVVLGVIGLCLWPTRFSGLGDNLIAVTIVVFVVGGMERLRKFLIVRPWGYRVLRMMGLKQQEVH
jgi:hypothetical protein